MKALPGPKMFPHGGGGGPRMQQPQQHHQHRQHQQQLYQGSPTVPVGVPPLAAGGSPVGASWVQLKTYPTRQPGQPYRGTRFNCATNKWTSVVSFQERDMEIASHDHEEDAALAHDKKVLELYGAASLVNFPFSALVDPATTRVHRLRTSSGREIPLDLEKTKRFRCDACKIPRFHLPSMFTTPTDSCFDVCQKLGFAGYVPSDASGQEMSHHRSSSTPHSPSVNSARVLGVNRYAGGAEVSRQPPMPVRMPRAPVGIDGPLQSEWMPRSDRAYTAADATSVANAKEHDAGLVYEISFPRTGALGLNLRSYFAELQAGARPGLPPYGCLELLEAQSVYLRVVIESGDFLIAINGQKLSGTNFNFEDAISRCSRASMPRVLRFARMKGASAAEIECALASDACAVFDAVHGPPQRLVTAQLHPSAPPYFYLNPPTRQPRRVSALPSATATGGGNDGNGDGGDDSGVSNDTAGASAAAAGVASPAAAVAIAVALSPATSVSPTTTATTQPSKALTSAQAGSPLPASSSPPAPPPSTTETCLPSTATPSASTATPSASTATSLASATTSPASMTTPLLPASTSLLSASTPLLSTTTPSSTTSPALQREGPVASGSTSLVDPTVLAPLLPRSVGGEGEESGADPMCIARRTGLGVLYS